jgi:hypothetical protein
VDDQQILTNINQLVEEEHALYRRAEADGGLDAAERERLRQLKVQLDQAWDLLDQRRALRGAGRDPDDAHERSANIVENYRQ